MTTGHLLESLVDRYRIQRELGAGGMAIVHLADDLRHSRRVAVKVLRPELAAIIGAERFLAEIRTTANLQHPHILPLFDSGTVNGTVFYVMPYVEGESLRDRLNREKQLPVDEAIRIAREVADALAYAHDHGVIHRDIKPENILLQGGHALVADFGIALAASRSDGGARLTETGMSLGTPHYMSPEQAMGQRELDGRVDIYALGCVLYEMLTGEPPFTGPTPQAIIAKVMTTAPVPVNQLRPMVPESVAEAVRAALQKIPADRPATAARFAAALDGSVPAGTTPRPGVQARRPASVRRALPWLVLTALIAAAAWRLGGSGSTAEAAPVTRFVLDMPRGYAVAVTRMPLALSPDGRTIAYITRQSGSNQVALRRIDQLLTRLVPGTEGARRIRFSPDGQSLIANLPAGISRVPLDGSALQLLVPNAIMNADPSATPTGAIVSNRIDRYRGLSLVGARGDRPRILAVPDTAQGEFEQRNPVVLADGKTILYTSFGGTLSRIGIASTDSGRATILPVPSLVALGYAEGHVIYVRADGVLAAVPVDLAARLATGPPVDLLEGVFRGGISTSAAWAGLSENGTLVYGRGSDDAVPVLVDESGMATPVDTVRRAYGFPRFSPDGQRIAYSVGDGLRSDIWVYHTRTGTLTRLTTGGYNDRPEWSPDGRRIVFRSDRGARYTLWSQPIDGSAVAEQFVDPGPASVHEGVFTPDGRAMVIRVQTDDGTNNLHLMPLAGERTLRLLVGARGQFALAPRISPDGQYLAYTSDESGEVEVYVRRLVGIDVPSRVSLSGGNEPVWSRDGKRLFYRVGRSLVAATLRGLPAGPGDSTGLEIERRDVIQDGSIAFATNGVRSMYDVSPDGKRFLMLRQSDDDGQVVVVVNWLTELRARLAEARRK